MTAALPLVVMSATMPPGPKEADAMAAPPRSRGGDTVQVPVLTCVLQSELPVRIGTIWRQSDPCLNPQEEPT